MWAVTGIGVYSHWHRLGHMTISGNYSNSASLAWIASSSWRLAVGLRLMDMAHGELFSCLTPRRTRHLGRNSSPLGLR